MGGLVVGALINAGLGFLAPFPGSSRTQRFRGAGITLGLTVGSYILQRWLNEDQQDASFATQIKKIEREIRSSVVDARYIVGTVKTSGAMVHYSDRNYGPRNKRSSGMRFGRKDIVPDEDERNVPISMAIQRRILALSELGISSIEEIFVDGRKMPFQNNNDLITPDLDGFDEQIEDLEARIQIIENEDGMQRAANNPLYIDLQRQLDELVSDRDEPVWIYDYVDRSGLVNIEIGSLPNVRIALDKGQSSTTKADERAALLLEETWDGTQTQLQNISWALIELRALEKDGPPWSGNLPSIQFILKGSIDDQYTENPAVVAKWYLKDICGFTDNDLEGVEEAINICDEDIFIPRITLTSSSNILDPVLKILYPGAVDDNGNIINANLPSAGEQTVALNEWNNRYAGVENAEKRYQCHGVITSSMLLNPQSLLKQLGFAMGGWIISNGSKFKFIPGHATRPVAKIEEHDLASTITENLGPLYEQRYNAIKANIAQLKTENYSSFSIESIIDNELASEEGYREENIGTLPFQNSEVASRRLLAKYRRRNNPELKRLGFTVNAGHDYKNYNIYAGDRIILDFPSENINEKIYRVIDSNYNLNGTVRLEIIEDPDSVWDDSFNPSTEGIIGKRTEKNPPIIKTGIRAFSIWRRVSIKDQFICVYRYNPDDSRETVNRSELNLIDNPLFSQGPYLRDNLDSLPVYPEASTDEQTIINLPAQRTGDFSTQFVLDIIAEFQERVKSLSIIVKTNDEEFIYNSNVSDLEIENRSATRTLRSNNYVKFFEPESTQSIEINVISYNEELDENGELQGDASIPYKFNIGPPGKTALGDLDDYAEESPLPGPGYRLRYDEEKEGWLPDKGFVLLPEGTDPDSVNLDDYLELTLVGIPFVDEE